MTSSNAGEVGLLPCPFCGGKAGLCGDLRTVQCMSCGAEAKESDSQRATLHWNTRAVLSTHNAEGWRDRSSVPTTGRPVDLWGYEEGWRENRPAAPGPQRLASCRYDRQGPCPGDGWYGWIMPSGRRVESFTHWRYITGPATPIAAGQEVGHG